MFFDARAAFFAVFLVPALILGGAGIKAAAADTGTVMSEGEYAEALAFIEGTKAVMDEAEAALGFHQCRCQDEIDLNAGARSLVGGNGQHVANRFVIFNPENFH